MFFLVFVLFLILTGHLKFLNLQVTLIKFEGTEFSPLFHCSFIYLFIECTCTVLSLSIYLSISRGGRFLVSCVPMREQKNDEKVKGYFFSSWAVCRSAS